MDKVGRFHMPKVQAWLRGIYVQKDFWGMVRGDLEYQTLQLFNRCPKSWNGRGSHIIQHHLPNISLKIMLPYIERWVSLVAQMVKNSPNAGDAGLIPELRRSPEEGNGNLLHILAWKISWGEEPGGLQSWWVAKSWTWLSNYTTIINWRIYKHGAGHNGSELQQDSPQACWVLDFTKTGRT